MCQQHGDIAFINLESNKKQHKTNGCYDFRIHHGQIIHLLHKLADNFLGLAKSNGSNGTGYGGNKGSQDCNAEGGIKCRHHVLGLQHMPVPP